MAGCMALPETMRPAGHKSFLRTLRSPPTPTCTHWQSPRARSGPRTPLRGTRGPPTSVPDTRCHAHACPDGAGPQHGPLGKARDEHAAHHRRRAVSAAATSAFPKRTQVGRRRPQANAPKATLVHRRSRPHAQPTRPHREHSTRRADVPPNGMTSAHLSETHAGQLKTGFKQTQPKPHTRTVKQAISRPHARPTRPHCEHQHRTRRAGAPPCGTKAAQP